MALEVLPSPQRVLFPLEQKHCLLPACVCQTGCRVLRTLAASLLPQAALSFLWNISLASTCSWLPPTLACRTALFGDPAVTRAPRASCRDAAGRRLCFPAGCTRFAVALSSRHYLSLSESVSVQWRAREAEHDRRREGRGRGRGHLCCTELRVFFHLGFCGFDW